MSEPTAWQKKLPMQLTLVRMYCVVPIIFCLYWGGELCDFLAGLLFILASITDYYDGYYARKYNAVSNAGKFMDPIADKVLVTSILTMLIMPGKLDPYLVIILSARDTFIGGIRSVAAADGTIIAAKSTGKWKTALQMIGIPGVVWGHIPFQPQIFTWFYDVGYGLLWVSAILSIISGVEYYRAYKQAKKGAH